jgi:hypothetical protein
MDKVRLASKITDHLTSAWICVNNGVVEASQEGDEETAEMLRDLRRKIATDCTHISLSVLEEKLDKQREDMVY